LVAQIVVASACTRADKVNAAAVKEERMMR
jgi:hypothetical protein